MYKHVNKRTRDRDAQSIDSSLHCKSLQCSIWIVGMLVPFVACTSLDFSFPLITRRIMNDLCRDISSHNRENTRFKSYRFICNLSSFYVLHEIERNVPFVLTRVCLDLLSSRAEILCYKVLMKDWIESFFLKHHQWVSNSQSWVL